MSNISPETVVQAMVNNDAFSKWLGIQVLAIKEG
jgi:hypothetical protein